MRYGFTVITAFAGTLCAAVVHAQADYPAKPIRIVIGTAAGGGSDLMGRLVGQQLLKAWNATVVPQFGQKKLSMNRPESARWRYVRFSPTMLTADSGKNAE